MTRYEALETIISALNDEDLALFTTGMTSREAFTIKDRESNFYMIGSMGLLSSLGLGIALKKPGRKVLVFDGDGSALMSLGSLAVVGDLRPKNFYHIVLDNKTYASTGGQPTVSESVEWEKLAENANYRNAYKADSLQELELELKDMLHKDGPSFLRAKVDAANVQGIGRVSHSPDEIKQRFIQAVAKEVSR